MGTDKVVLERVERGGGATGSDRVHISNRK